MGAYAMNLIDLACTIHALRHGAAELNPVMRCLPLMILYKVVIIGALCLWLGNRREAIARVGLGICTAAFGAVDLWHMVNLIAAWAA